MLDVWLGRPDLAADAATFRCLQGVLSSEEREHLAVFAREPDAREYLVSRAQLRIALSQTTGLAPQHWRFASTALGRPVLVPGQSDLDLRFSLSHADGLVACVVARGRDVGIDVERIPRELAATELADRFFAPEESADLRAQPVEERITRFIRYWTLKESYLKARGTGLSAPLHNCVFRLGDDEGGDQNRLVTDAGDSASWRFWQWNPTAEHTLAIAAEVVGDASTELRMRGVTEGLRASRARLGALARRS